MTGKILETLGDLVVRFPRAVALLYGTAAAASLVAALLWLGLKTDQNDLMAADVEHNRRFFEFLEKFDDLEFMYVVVEVEGRPDRAIRVAEEIVAEVRALEPAGHVKSVFHRIPLDELGYGLLFRDVADLRRLVESLKQNRDSLRALSRTDRFERLLAVFRSMMSVERLAPDGVNPPDAEFGRLGFSVLSVVLSALDAALEGNAVAAPEASLEREFDASLRDRGYLVTENEKFLLVEILPAKDTTSLELIRAPLAAIRGVLDRVKKRFPGVKLGLTGRPVFQADEMTTTDEDMRTATIAALLGVLLLFVYFFRRLKRPLIAVLCLVLSIVLTFGVASVTIGYLTLLSIVFAAMLVGLGIDFSIHFVARYQEELAGGSDVDAAVRKTLTTAGTSIGTGALTTAAAFFTTLLVDFKGLRELGFIAGVGVLLCFVSMVTLLPALLLLIDRHAERAGSLALVPVRQVSLFLSPARRPWPIVALLGAMTLLGIGLCIGLSRFPRYDYNLLDLQATGLESVDYERRLIEESDTATWYAAFIVDTLEDVRRTVDSLQAARQDGIVGKVESPLDVLPEDQNVRMSLLAEAAAALADVDFAVPSREVDVEALGSSLDSLLDTIDDLQQGVVGREDEESREAAAGLDALARRIEAVAAKLRDASAETLSRLPEVQESWFKGFVTLARKLRDALEFGPLTPETLPAVLRNRYVSRSGEQFLIYAYPKKDIWEEENAEEFLRAVRAIDPHVTGTPVTAYESAWRMRDGFVRSAFYAAAVVFVLLLIDLRSLGKTLLAMVPLAAGLLWLLESLSFVGLAFNLANFFAVPILIGCGIDGGVHIVHRFSECGSASEVGRTTCVAVMLSFLTTMVGFGAMGFASHRGVASLGQVMALGLLCLLVASVILLPALLALIERRRQRRGREPGKAAQ